MNIGITMKTKSRVRMPLGQLRIKETLDSESGDMKFGQYLPSLLCNLDGVVEKDPAHIAASCANRPNVW